MTTILDGCAVVTVDAGRREFTDGHVVIEGNRIAAVGAGRAPEITGADRRDGDRTPTRKPADTYPDRQ